MREYALLRSGFLFIAPGPAAGTVEFVLGKGIQQGNRLQLIAGGAVSFLFHDLSLINGLLDRADNQLSPQFLDQSVAIGQRLGEIVTGIDMDQGERQSGWIECLIGQIRQDDGILPSGKEDTRVLELGRDLPEDIDGLCLQFFEMRELFHNSFDDKD